MVKCSEKNIGGVLIVAEKPLNLSNLADQFPITNAENVSTSSIKKHFNYI